MGRARIASGLATTNKQTIALAFGTTTRVRRDRHLTNRGLPHQRHKASKARPTATESLDTVTPTVTEARGFPLVQMPSEVQIKCGVSGTPELHERVNDGQEREPRGGEAERPK